MRCSNSQLKFRRASGLSFDSARRTHCLLRCRLAKRYVREACLKLKQAVELSFVGRRVEYSVLWKGACRGTDLAFATQLLDLKSRHWRVATALSGITTD